MPVEISTVYSDHLNPDLPELGVDWLSRIELLEVVLVVNRKLIGHLEFKIFHSPRCTKYLHLSSRQNLSVYHFTQFQG